MTQEMERTQYNIEQITDTVIRKLADEIEQYKQAIRDAKDALAAAEMELDEELDARYRDEMEGGN